MADVLQLAAVALGAAVVAMVVGGIAALCYLRGRREGAANQGRMPGPWRPPRPPDVRSDRGGPSDPSPLQRMRAADAGLDRRTSSYHDDVVSSLRL